MSAKAREWSLAARMHGRLALATCAVTVMTSLIVAFHYGGDPSDLRQRKVLERAESISREISALDFNGLIALDEGAMREEIFVEYPDAYGWRVWTIVTFWQAHRLTGMRYQVFQIEADEWTHALEAGGWVAGKRFDCDPVLSGRGHCIGDPANRLVC